MKSSTDRPQISKPGNPRTHSDKELAKLEASIQTFGFTIPVLVDEAGVILSGHGRVQAAKALGGEGGIRTRGTLLAYTRFPGVHLRPLGHLSVPANLKRRAILSQSTFPGFMIPSGSTARLTARISSISTGDL